MVNIVKSKIEEIQVEISEDFKIKESSKEEKQEEKTSSIKTAEARFLRSLQKYTELQFDEISWAKSCATFKKDLAKKKFKKRVENNNKNKNADLKVVFLVKKQLNNEYVAGYKILTPCSVTHFEHDVDKPIWGLGEEKEE